MHSQQNNKHMPGLLKKRFQDLWRRCLPASSSFAMEAVYCDLLRRYSNTGRYYHNLDHVFHCLNQLDLASQVIPHPEAVEMALWFHDAVYVPGNADNEQKSAELFLHNAAACFSGDFKNKVKNLILVTTHKDIPKDEDECFIVDIDLSSFGSDWSDFLTDTGNLRKEQPDISDQAYCQAHARFLNSLLARKRIFQTDFFYVRYEQIAIQNITCLLAEPKSQGYD